MLLRQMHPIFSVVEYFWIAHAIFVTAFSWVSLMFLNLMVVISMVRTENPRIRASRHHTLSGLSLRTFDDGARRTVSFMAFSSVFVGTNKATTWNTASILEWLRIRSRSAGLRYKLNGLFSSPIVVVMCVTKHCVQKPVICNIIDACKNATNSNDVAIMPSAETIEATASAC